MNVVDVGDGVEVILIDGVMVDSPEMVAFIVKCIERHGYDANHHKKMLTAYALMRSAMEDDTNMSLN